MTSRVCACAARLASIPRLPRIARPLARPPATLSPLRRERGNDSTDFQHARTVRGQVDDGINVRVNRRVWRQIRELGPGARTNAALNDRRTDELPQRARTRTNSASTRARKIG